MWSALIVKTRFTFIAFISIIKKIYTSFSLKGQLVTDKNNRMLGHMYIILFPVWAGINFLFIYLRDDALSHCSYLDQTFLCTHTHTDKTMHGGRHAA